MWAELKQRETEAWKLNVGPEKHLFLPYKEWLHSQHLEFMLNSKKLSPSISYSVIKNKTIKGGRRMEKGRESASYLLKKNEFVGKVGKVWY